MQPMQSLQIIKNEHILYLIPQAVKYHLSTVLKQYRLNLMSDLDHFEMRLNHETNVCTLLYTNNDWSSFPIQIGFFKLNGKTFYPANSKEYFLHLKRMKAGSL